MTRSTFILGFALCVLPLIGLRRRLRRRSIRFLVKAQDGAGMLGCLGVSCPQRRLRRTVQKLESSISCRIPVVVAKKSAKPLAATQLPFLHQVHWRSLTVRKPGA
jgi:hypothetical protein